MKFEEKTFSNGRVQLDNNFFDRCTFNNCQLVVSGTKSGTAQTGMTNCVLNEVTLVFDGPAASTLQMLTALYGGGFKHIIDELFDDVRKGLPTRNPPQARDASITDGRK